MDTVKFDKKNTRIIAHRGLSGLECENTCAAFVAAGNRSYYGIETDMHLTEDGKFAIIHDATTSRVSGVNANVEELSFDKVADIRLFDKESGITRRDLVIPTLDEYIRICRRYEKIAVLELKGNSDPVLYAEMIKLIRELGHFDKTIFISFGKQNALDVRSLSPEAKIQLLKKVWEDYTLDFLIENDFGLDINHTAVTKELVDLLHSKGIEINCWTVDSKERGEELAAMGVDYITSNILE